MTRKLTRLAVSLSLMMGLAAGSASAWEPQARQKIVLMAMQLVRPAHPTFFRPLEAPITYEKDVIQGVTDGLSALNERVSFTNPKELMQLIDAQIELLRDVRSYGPTSYYAYRMGALAALAADLVLPYGVVFTESEKPLQTAINRDIEAHLDDLVYANGEKELMFLMDTVKYFEARRRFYPADQAMIASDYDAGKGYNGYLSDSVAQYFTRAAESVADVWHTILKTEQPRGRAATPKNNMAWYFVDEIDFLLNAKDNLFLADKVYRNFEQVSEDMPDPYEKLGDLYYQYDGEEGVERGVREWRIAYGVAGPTRNQIAQKLAQHFMEVGDKLILASKEPGAPDLTLPNALNAFTQALEYDRRSSRAEERIQLANQLIQERKARLDENLTLLAKAQETVEAGNQSRGRGEFTNAIIAYQKAMSVFDSVTDEFTDVHNTAQEGHASADDAINDVVTEVLGKADSAIANGESAVDEHRFEQAVDLFESVPSILGSIPEGVTEKSDTDKEELNELARQKIEEAKIAKTQWEKRLAEQEAAAAQGGNAARAAQPAQPAQTTTPGMPMLPGMNMPNMPGMNMPNMPGMNMPQPGQATGGR